MLDLLSIILLASGLFVGWGLGVNDAANCIGPSIGAGAINHRKAILLFAIFAIIGATVQGFHTINSIGGGIIDSSSTDITALISILLATAIMVTIFASLGIPVSTTQAILGGIAAIGLTETVKTNWGRLYSMLGASFVTPIIAIIVSYFAYKYFAKSIFNMPFLKSESRINFLLILSSAALSYSLGSNNVGNAMGLVVGKDIMGPFIGGLLGGIALSIGAATLGRRVIRTISSEIMQIDAVMALSIQFAAAITVYMFTLIGIPTSLTSAMLGSMIGIGLVKGVASIELETIKKISFGWVTSPFIAALLTVIINSIIS